MEISQKGLEFIASFEAFMSKPYHDQKGIPTIGYGTTVYPNNKRVTMNDPPITITQAAAYKISHIKTKCYPELIKYTGLLQHEFDALCSGVYNAGPLFIQNGNGVDASIRNWLKGNKSNPYQVHIMNAFGAWNKVRNPETNILEVSNGLTRRRREEGELFTKGDYVIA